MAITPIFINNLTSARVSVDASFLPKRVIRTSIPALGSINVSAIATLDELNRHPTLLAMRQAGKISITQGREGVDDIMVVSGTMLAALQTRGMRVGETRTIYANLTAGGATGTGDVVEVMGPNAGRLPYPIKIVGMKAYVTTLIAASTCTLRETSSGSSTVIGAQFATDTAGLVVATAAAPLAATRDIVANGGIYAHRSDRAAAFELVLDIVRLPA